MHRVLCFVGIHDWEHHVNHQMGGPSARYDLCSTAVRRDRPPYPTGGSRPTPDAAEGTPEPTEDPRPDPRRRNSLPARP